MTSYELSISADYVPSWGVVEAVREFFQNALDEETRDPKNKMFFSYDFTTQVLRIGNRYGKLDAKSLLLGYTEKNNQKNMIGNHGEGYKIATVVLLRLNKQLTFYNYGCRQIWRPRFVNSRKYGAVVPTFFVEKKAVWEKVPDNDLVIEISGITAEEYRQIEENNLHLVGGSYSLISTMYGDLLMDSKYKSKVFVGGLYICEDPDLEIGVDFHPDVVHLERDRTMVNSFDLRFYVSKMIEMSKDVDLIKRFLSTPAGEYIRYYNICEIGDQLAQQFLDEYGEDAVPVAEQKDAAFFTSKNTIIVSRPMRDIILNSAYYQQHVKVEDTDLSLVSVRLIEFGKTIRERLSDSEVEELATIIKAARKLEER